MPVKSFPLSYPSLKYRYFKSVFRSTLRRFQFMVALRLFTSFKVLSDIIIIWTCFFSCVLVLCRVRGHIGAEDNHWLCQSYLKLANVFLSSLLVTPDICILWSCFHLSFMSCPSECTHGWVWSSSAMWVSPNFRVLFLWNLELVH